ncbi:hypothetical protein [Neorhizobium galegae]|uniref:Uncharacterized protein n=1 Tax=Neorhizobium galegae bv. orientalis str. HAMBI 540 TaxID=1028800 RepID=A0A068SX55_NEOGA|nr:hypothetical protein [Neorhizobium galegae]CDN50852.1 Hypothetical protein RG540_PA01730 [Neorhizobium galegae bv. orientalis str. HAMBI 540]CDZ43725.1 Hypothetical protein NGAL_HAMBI2427_03580 [Neorhizobium galegae bv. orientalis]
MTSPLFKILRRLDDANIHYFIERYQPDTVDITATVVGQRIEITVFEDDRVWISRFVGHETIEDEDILNEIIDQEIRAGQDTREKY